MVKGAFKDQQHHPVQADLAASEMVLSVSPSAVSVSPNKGTGHWPRHWSTGQRLTEAQLLLISEGALTVTPTVLIPDTTIHMTSRLGVLGGLLGNHVSRRAWGRGDTFIAALRVQGDYEVHICLRPQREPWSHITSRHYLFHRKAPLHSLN